MPWRTGLRGRELLLVTAWEARCRVAQVACEWVECLGFFCSLNYCEFWKRLWSDLACSIGAGLAAGPALRLGESGAAWARRPDPALRLNSVGDAVKLLVCGQYSTLHVFLSYKNRRTLTGCLRAGKTTARSHVYLGIGSGTGSKSVAQLTRVKMSCNGQLSGGCSPKTEGLAVSGVCEQWEVMYTHLRCASSCYDDGDMESCCVVETSLWIS